MQRATITSPDGKVRTVKNLGWLLRHWKDVTRVAVNISTEQHTDCVLVAYTRNGSIYETPYASLTVLFGFLDRPVFRGLPFHIRAGVIPFGEFTGAIADEAYKALQARWDAREKERAQAQVNS